MYNGNIYIPDAANAEFYNYQNQTWKFWPNLPLDLGFVSCNILWRDSFVLAGGSSITYGILKFNFTTNKWTILKNMTEGFGGPGKILRINECGMVADAKSTPC